MAARAKPPFVGTYRDIATVRLPRDLIDRMSRHREAQRTPPTRTAVIEAALREYLDRQDQAGQPS